MDHHQPATPMATDSVKQTAQNTQVKDWGHATAQRPSTVGEKGWKYFGQTSVSGDLCQVKVRPKWGSDCNIHTIFVTVRHAT